MTKEEYWGRFNELLEQIEKPADEKSVFDTDHRGKTNKKYYDAEWLRKWKRRANDIVRRATDYEDPARVKWAEELDKHNDARTQNVEATQNLIDRLRDVAQRFDPEEGVSFPDEIRLQLHTELLAEAEAVLAKGWKVASVIIAGATLLSHMKAKNLKPSDETDELVSYHKRVVRDPTMSDLEPEKIRAMMKEIKIFIDKSL
jgi:hypothetical protein